MSAARFLTENIDLMPMNPDSTFPAVWVVEDNPTDLFFLQHRLQAAGFQWPFVHAEDGADALRLLERCLSGQDDRPLPGLMFLDLKMPRIDGFGVLKRLNEWHLLDRMTVAVVSTSDEPEDVEQARRLGAHCVLLKYPRPSELSNVVALAIRRAAEMAAEPHPTEHR